MANFFGLKNCCVKLVLFFSSKECYCLMILSVFLLEISTTPVVVHFQCGLYNILHECTKVHGIDNLKNGRLDSVVFLCRVNKPFKSAQEDH